jgi:hypothetical protein
VSTVCLAIPSCDCFQDSLLFPLLFCLAHASFCCRGHPSCPLSRQCLPRSHQSSGRLWSSSPFSRLSRQSCCIPARRGAGDPRSRPQICTSSSQHHGNSATITITITAFHLCRQRRGVIALGIRTGRKGDVPIDSPMPLSIACIVHCTLYCTVCVHTTQQPLTPCQNVALPCDSPPVLIAIIWSRRHRARLFKRNMGAHMGPG